MFFMLLYQLSSENKELFLSLEWTVDRHFKNVSHPDIITYRIEFKCVQKEDKWMDKAHSHDWIKFCNILCFKTRRFCCS